MLKHFATALSALLILSACSHNSPESTAKTGMINLAPNIYVDRAMPVTDHTRFLKTVERSRSEIKRFFNGMQSNPNIYAC